jgi:site-specific recombinase XerD
VIAFPDVARSRNANPVEIYLASLSGSDGPRSMRAKIERALSLAGFPELDPNCLPEIALIAKGKLQKQGAAPSYVRATLVALRGVAKVAYQCGLIPADICEKLRSIEGPKGKALPAGRALPEADKAALMDACAADKSIAGVRDAAILALFMATGVRCAECASLKLASYSEAKGELHVLGKGKRERMMYLRAAPARMAMSDWLKVRGLEPGHLFYRIRGSKVVTDQLTTQAIYGVLIRRAKEARITATPHDMRRTFATELLKKGVDVLTVQELLGHANVSTTGIYNRRGEEAKRTASGMVSVPYSGRYSQVPLPLQNEAADE